MSKTDVVRIGSRLEPLVDPWIIDRLEGGARHRLHEPVPRNVVLRTDAPWEGNRGGYATIFADGSMFRMYYFAHRTEIYVEGEDDAAEKPNPSSRFALTAGAGPHKERQELLKICYAESEDGIWWHKPDLGLYEFEGSRDNNIIWMGTDPGRRGVHGFAPFLDTNPTALREARYKAVGTKHGPGARDGLYVMRSADAIHWELMRDEPVLTKGKFDSQNLAFWDPEIDRYRAYLRDFHEGAPDEGLADDTRMGIRDIRTSTSADFIHWTDPVPLEYTGSEDEPLYINQIAPYARAPHILLGFPARYVERPWGKAVELLPGLEERRQRSAVSTRYGTVVTDARFMASRDGRRFHKWPQVFLRPGPQREDKWVYGDNYPCWGLFETVSDLPGAPNEFSFVASENYWRSTHTAFRRYSIRKDGFASVWADMYGGEMVTRPLIFAGNDLYLNFSSSAAGRVKAEIQDRSGHPVEGFSLQDAVENVGDELDRRVHWKSGKRPGELAGRVVRLHFSIKDTDLYAFRFG